MIKVCILTHHKNKQCHQNQQHQQSPRNDSIEWVTAVFLGIGTAMTISTVLFTGEVPYILTHVCSNVRGKTTVLTSFLLCTLVCVEYPVEPIRSSLCRAVVWSEDAVDLAEVVLLLPIQQNM